MQVPLSKAKRALPQYQDENTFREMEDHWAEALKGSIELDPTRGTRRNTQATLKLKLVQSRLSFEQQHWKSLKIPLASSLRRIEIIPLDNGNIRLKNAEADETAFKKAIEERDRALKGNRLDIQFSKEKLAEVITNLSQYADRDICVKCSNMEEEMAMMLQLGEIEFVKIDNGTFRLLID